MFRDRVLAVANSLRFLATLDVRASLDQLVLKPGQRRIRAHGWALDSKGPSPRVRFVIGRDGAPDLVLEARTGMSRPDIATAFPHVPGSARAGFELMSWLEPGVRAREIAVIASGSEGRDTVIWRQRLRRDEVVHPARPSTRSGPADLIALLERAPSRTLVVDHSLGGGANFDRDRRIAALLSTNAGVCLYSHDLVWLEHRLTGMFGPHRVDIVADAAKGIEGIAAALSFDRIIVNNLVSYDDPLEMLSRLRLLRQSVRSLEILVHDYFAVCPHWTLLDDTGKYCGVPSLARCARCLAATDDALLRALVPPTDIVSWRAGWAKLLADADTIVCFSHASKAIMARAYPALADRIVVEPHRVDYLKERPALPTGGPLVIGVVGHISVEKGARIVADLARLIDARRLDARIVVVGQLDVAVPSDTIHVTGPYRREDLPRHLLENKVTVGFLPSIWPETFSYVTEELITLGVPLAAFALGAPAERLRHYPRGSVIEEISADAALESLMRLHRTHPPNVSAC